MMQQKIQLAFLELLKDRPLHEVSIKHIALQAKIHRATFYVYYGSKESLYDAITEELLYALENTIKPAPHLTLEEIEQLFFINNRPLQEAILFLEHIEVNRHFYEVLMRDIKFQKSFANIISEGILQGNILPRIYTQHMAYGAIGLVTEWLQNPEHLQLEEIARYLTRNIIHSLLDYHHQIENQLIKRDNY